MEAEDKLKLMHDLKLLSFGFLAGSFLATLFGAIYRMVQSGNQRQIAEQKRRLAQLNEISKKKNTAK